MHNYPHCDLVSVLKRCPKGNQANFGVIRPAIEELPNHNPGDHGVEPFTVLEVRLIHQVSGSQSHILPPPCPYTALAITVWMELNPHTSYMPAEDNEPRIPQGIRRCSSHDPTHRPISALSCSPTPLELAV
eukprot:Em0001g394a